MDKNFPFPPPVLPPGVRFEQNVYITMRDGVKIAVDIYRPEKEGKYPAIFSTSAYMKAVQTAPPELSHSTEAGAIFFMVAHGYVHVIGQARGSGLSQGQYNWYDKEEQMDGYETIEWIAKQPWCNGNVGMLGDSYFARIQWLIAGLQPPHLKCLAPYDASMDDYRSRREGGLIFGGFIYRWSGDTALQCMTPWPVEGKLPPTNLIMQLGQNPDDGPLYRERSGITNVDKIKIPVLNMVEGGSALHSRSQLAGYNALKCPKKLLILPVVHGLANAFFVRSRPLNEYIVRWFDTWLKGIDTGIMNEPEVMVIDRATKECRYENEYPIARTKWTKFYLHSNAARPATKAPYGILNQESPQQEDPDTYGEPEASEIQRQGKPVLAYTSEPLEADMKVWGPLSATLYAATTSRDTGWFVRVSDIAPDGKSTGLTLGQLKASYREVDVQKSTIGSPYHPFKNGVLPESGKIYEYQIGCIPIFYTFKKGHKIWVQIASFDKEYMDALSTVYSAELGPIPCKNSIHHDGAHQSHLLLPIIPDAPIIKPVPAPLNQIKWPLEETKLLLPAEEQKTK